MGYKLGYVHNGAEHGYVGLVFIRARHTPFTVHPSQSHVSELGPRTTVHGSVFTMPAGGPNQSHGWFKNFLKTRTWPGERVHKKWRSENAYLIKMSIPIANKIQ